MARTDFSLNAHTRKLHRTAREIITPEQYVEVIKDLLRQAFLRDDERTALAAKKLIIEYIEGKPTERVEVTSNAATVSDILIALRGQHESEGTE